MKRLTYWLPNGTFCGGRQGELPPGTFRGGRQGELPPETFR